MTGGSVEPSRPGAPAAWREFLRRAGLAVLPVRAAVLLARQNDDLGRLGERVAARWLEERGWRIVARRLHTPHAEIDLLVRAGRVLACVEVKTGRLLRAPCPPRTGGSPGRITGPLNSSQRPFYSRSRPGLRLDGERLSRLWLAAEHLAMRAPGHRTTVDLIEVTLGPRFGTARVVHHPGIEHPL